MPGLGGAFVVELSLMVFLACLVLVNRDLNLLGARSVGFVMSDP